MKYIINTWSTRFDYSHHHLAEHEIYEDTTTESIENIYRAEPGSAAL